MQPHTLDSYYDVDLRLDRADYERCTSRTVCTHSAHDIVLVKPEQSRSLDLFCMTMLLKLLYCGYSSNNRMPVGKTYHHKKEVRLGQSRSTSIAGC